MNEGKSCVTTDQAGMMRVGKGAVPLESVLAGFEQGHAPETIRSQYPALTLEEVYGAITYSLAQPQEVRQYLKRQGALWEQWREKIEQAESPVVPRLRAMRNARVREAV